MSKIYVGDVGTLVQVETGQDLTGATSLTLEVRKPGGALTTWAATPQGTKLLYISSVESFDQSGIWKLQSRVILPSGAWRGETAIFEVFPPFS